MPTADLRAGGTSSLFVWSRRVYLASPDVHFRPAETSRASGAIGIFVPVFYWIDDEDDVARYVGQQVEVVGELSDDLDKGEIDIDHHDSVTEIKFKVKGHEAKAVVPRAWLGPAAAHDDAELDVAVRTVDLERVTPLGPCPSR
jgi:hypothetical protein